MKKTLYFSVISVKDGVQSVTGGALDTMMRLRLLELYQMVTKVEFYSIPNYNVSSCCSVYVCQTFGFDKCNVKASRSAKASVDEQQRDNDTSTEWSRRPKRRLTHRIRC